MYGLYSYFVFVFLFIIPYVKSFPQMPQMFVYQTDQKRFWYSGKQGKIS